jgi:hypothetical protein
LRAAASEHVFATADLNADLVLTAGKQWLKTSGLNCESRDIASGG